jgi:hypothetical protein
MDQQTITALTALVVAIGTLITTIISLIKIFQHGDAIANTNEKVNTIEKNTDGVMSTMQAALHAGTRTPGSRRASDPPAPEPLPPSVPKA